MGGPAAQLGRKLIGWKHSRHDCSVLQSSFPELLNGSASLQGTDSLVDRRQLFVSLDHIDSEITDGSFLHRFDAFETKQPCGAGSQTCAATALVRRVYLPGYVSTRYHTQYSGSVRLTVLALANPRSFCQCRAQLCPCRDYMTRAPNKT